MSPSSFSSAIAGYGLARVSGGADDARELVRLKGRSPVSGDGLRSMEVILDGGLPGPWVPFGVQRGSPSTPPFLLPLAYPLTCRRGCSCSPVILFNCQ